MLIEINPTLLSKIVKKYYFSKCWAKLLNQIRKNNKLNKVVILFMLGLTPTTNSNLYFLSYLNSSDLVIDLLQAGKIRGY